MNRYLMLTAAGLLASNTGASAGTFCFTFASSVGDPYCDGGRVSTGVDGGAHGGAVRSWVHTSANCVGGTGQGQGLLGKIPGLGKISNMSDTYLAKYYGMFSEQLSYTLPKKFLTGYHSQPWTLWIGFNGTTSFEGDSGILDNVSNCQNVAGHRGTRSTLEHVTELLAANRNRQTPRTAVSLLKRN